VYGNRYVVMCLALLALGTPAPARAQLKAGPGDWPGWRGPDRTGVSTETGLLPKWPEGGPKLLWKATGLGGGFSTPSVAAGRIYLMGSKDREEYAIALDEGDKQLWSTKIGPVGKDGPPSYPGPRSTPTVDGDRVYVLGSAGDLACLDLDGKVLWHKNLIRDLGGTVGRWAYAESPLIDGDVLVCTPGGPTDSLAALKKQTGEVLWKARVPNGGEAAYASAIVADAGGVKQYIQFLRNGVAGVAARDGKFLWQYRKIATPTNCSTPIFHDGYVFESGAGPGGGGCSLLQLAGDNSDGSAKQVYYNTHLANHHGGVVLVDGSVYGTTQTGLVCLDFKTGEVKWQDRSVGKGSVTAADGHLYVRGENGAVALVEATPSGYKETGRFNQPDRSRQPAWPYPVVAGGRLYLRDGDVLLCYDVKAK
jgi:outer membrane protein assembly factor BamB